VERAVSRAVERTLNARDDLVDSIDRGDVTASTAARQVLAEIAENLTRQ